MLIETLLERLPDTPIVSGSGMAGYGSANAMRTERRFGRLYVCGDGTSDIADGIGPVSYTHLDVYKRQNYNMNHDMNDSYDLGCEMERKRLECAICLKAMEKLGAD